MLAGLFERNLDLEGEESVDSTELSRQPKRQKLC